MKNLQRPKIAKNRTVNADTFMNPERGGLYMAPPKKTPPPAEEVAMNPPPLPAPDGIELREYAQALEIQNADRLAYLRVFQSAHATIESAIATLQSDVRQINAGIEARQAKITAMSQEAAVDSEKDDE